MRISLRLLARVLLVVSVVATAGVGRLAAPADAHITSAACPSHLHTGTDMVNAACYSWRSSYILDVGTGRYVDRADLARYAPVYAQYGFPANFTWYAAETTRTFRRGVDDHVHWAHCEGDSSRGWPAHEVDWNNNGNATGLCTERIVPAEQRTNSLLDAFASDVVTLRVLAHGDAFIALECGNFSARPASIPTPTISGLKFDDRNWNGVQDAGEPGLAGWEMRLFRDSSLVGQPTGFTGVRLTTGADGRYRFVLQDLGPGTYHVEEVQQPGYAQTRAPGSVHVPFGAGSTDYSANDFGNANRTDVVKADWDVVEPPTRIEAGVPTALTLRATITNLGPAPEVDVTDTMTVTGHQPDCVVAPARQAVTRRLRKGEPVTLDFAVTVTCEDPSNHFFVFGNVVTVEGGLVDPDEHNNARSTSVTIPVFDDSDVSVTDALLDCPTRTDVDIEFVCTGTAVVRNAGPYGSTDTAATLTVIPPADCDVADGTARESGRLTVPLGGAVPISGVWRITCADRSYHPVTLDASVAIVHEHVEDHWPANDAATVTDTVEVFEAADLSVQRPVRIACGGRLPTVTTFDCQVVATVSNAGPATAVLTGTTATLAAPADCVVSPASAALPTTLDAGESETLAYHFDVTCSETVLHTMLATVSISAAEPHAEDRDLSNNTERVRWLPTDPKPRSEPSSVNVGKDGVVPVAILSTPELDAFTDVDRESLRWGVTGFEDSLVGCGGAAEDTNNDGLADLVCRFETRLAGLTCDTRTAILTGRLTDGTPFESQDPVNITGCRR